MTQRLVPTPEPIIVDAPQRSDAWFAARLGNVTASEVSKVMEFGKPTVADMKIAHQIYIDGAKEPMSEEYAEWIDIMSTQYPIEFCLQIGIELKESAARAGYKQTLVAERITRLPDTSTRFVTDSMKWGIYNESIAISRYQMMTKNITKTSPLYLHPQWLCGASPDADVIEFETDELGNAEVKCLDSKNHLYKVIREDAVPDDYIPQIQFQMYINGKNWCDFIGYDSRVAEGLDIFVKRVPYDQFYITNVLEPALKRFLDECDTDERLFAAIMRQNLKQREILAADQLWREVLNSGNSIS